MSLTSTKNSGLVFSTIFVIIYIGSIVITVNNTLLGGHMYKIVKLGLLCNVFAC